MLLRLKIKGLCSSLHRCLNSPESKTEEERNENIESIVQKLIYKQFYSSNAQKFKVFSFALFINYSLFSAILRLSFLLDFILMKNCLHYTPRGFNALFLLLYKDNLVCLC